MPEYIFTNKFKVGDEVVILKNRYPEAWLQSGDIGIVVQVDEGSLAGYYVQKKGRPKNEQCFEREDKIDFADIDKRQSICRPINSNRKRLLLIKKLSKNKELAK